MIDIVIIGSGVAGLTAGIYAGRANKSVLIIEENNLGGTTANLNGIENYPGFVKVDGIELVQNMQMQCMQFGVNFEFGTIVSIDFDNNIITMADKNQIEYKTLIIACGSSSRKLNIEGEDIFKFKGVSYCAICDGNLYKNKKLVVFTNNNSAKNDVDYLLNISKDVTVLDTSNGYQNSNVKVLSNIKPVEITGDNVVKNITIDVDGKKQTLDCDGIFIDLGKYSNLDLYRNYINIENNQILSDVDMHTNKSNVFVAGDVRKKSLKQIITACSDGAIAATEAIKFLNK